MSDLSRSWLATSPQIPERLANVLARGWFVHGPEHESFESELSASLGPDVESVAVASGTDALKIALAALGCGPGSVVMVAPNAGGYASVAASGIGCRVVYADVDSDTLLLTPQSVEDSLDDDVSAVVVTHLYGNVADVAGIAQLSRPRGIRVIEDCAQAIGGIRDGAHAGTVSDAGCFSFYPTKNLGAAGDGGAVVTRDKALAQKARKLRQYGWLDKYNIGIPGGTNSRLDEIQAAILRVGLPLLGVMNARRQLIVSQYRNSIRGGPLRMVSGAGSAATGHLAVIQAPSGQARARARDLLLKLGVASDIHYPIADNRQLGLPPPSRLTDVSVAEWACDTVFSVPCFPELTDYEVELVSNSLAEVGELLG